ncbi:MAG: PD-(D/E)XK nuclease family protein [Oscillospiraceae bacterium]|nr:PD-(D/E)XK nuclease family protein [Oscillospiraceae bacterium]
MLRTVEGGAGSGKSVKIMEEIRARAQAGERVVLLVPEQYSFEAEREYWLSLGPVLSENVQVFSFGRLAEEIFRLYGGAAGERAGETVRLLLMRETLKACRPMLELYGKNAARPDFVGEMLHSAEELKRAAVTPMMLEKAAASCESESLKEKLCDLALITEGYDALLARTFLDPTDDLERAAKKAGEHHYFAGKHLYLDGFKSFTARQLELIRLALVEGEVTVSLCLEEESGLFEGVLETRRRLRALAVKSGCPIAPPVKLGSPRYASAALRHFTEQVLRPVPKPFEGENNAVFAAGLYSPFDEADHVAAKICELVREGYRYRDIAVVGRDMDTRATALEASFERYGIPWFRDGGETADTMPLIRFVRRYAAMTAGNLPREEVLAFFKCGMLDLSPEEISAFEDYTYVWNCSGDRFREPFTQHPRGFTDRPMGPREKKELAMAEALRQKAVEAADTLKQHMTRNSLPESIWKALEDLEIPARIRGRIDAFLTEQKELEAENEKRAYEALTEFLSASARLSALRADEGESDLTLREFRELLALSACSKKLAERPQTLDSVLLGSAERIRTGEKKIVFAVGAEDRVFPAAPSQSGVFTDRERISLREAGMLLDNTVEQKLIDERFVAYQTVSTPSERLYLSYALGDAAGKPQVYSELISSFKAVFPGSPVRTQREMDPADLCQSRSTTFLQYARCRAEEDAFAASLRTVLEDDSYYRERVEKLRDAEKLSTLVMNDPELALKMFAGAAAVSGRSYALKEREEGLRYLVTGRRGSRIIRLSPSQIERFYSCPFSYFCRYGLKLNPRMRAELSPVSRGSVIHYVLENVLQRPDFTTLSDEKLGQLTGQYLAEYLLQVMGGEPGKSAKFLYYFGRLEKTLLGILKALRAEFSQTVFRVAGLEEVIAKGGTVEPLKIDTAHGQVQVGGKIDRVDWAELGGERYVRVVDYKSGRKEFSLDEAREGLNLQMLLYLFAIWQSKNGKYQNIRPAGILYMPARTAEPKLSRDQQSDPDSGYRMNGLLLEDRTVLEAMEPGLAGKYLPVTVNKNGTYRGKTLIGPDELVSLRQQAFDLVAQMTEDLCAGKVAPAPRENGGHTPCSWCDYRAVCGKEREE